MPLRHAARQAGKRGREGRRQDEVGGQAVAGRRRDAEAGGSEVAQMEAKGSRRAVAHAVRFIRHVADAAPSLRRVLRRR